MKDSIFYRQANLVLDILPLIAKFDSFALKGGTTINYFIRDLPRLSVDIDLTYLPIEDRPTTLDSIHSILDVLSKEITDTISPSSITPKLNKTNQKIERLVIERSGVTIKIEPNLIIRGSVYPPVEMTLVPAAYKFFEKSVRVQTLSLEDLYGGKICAALDRQHPRDLFDIKMLFDNEGITDKIRTAFIVYLISHNRPMNELLNPTFQDISHQFKIEFENMMFNRITLDELNHARKELVTRLMSDLTEPEKQFLVSVKSKKPRWDLIEVEHIKDLPAVKWKLLNLEKMDKESHEEALTKLIRIFE
ncbi:MAG: nucleotidyl transferase AbiEii/AbiGii toxin family protein [Calditrichae bacterium]|nr:nucleotidyl transferase AbiEii/AbiGii toxin family protein [Calditrichia bacterium]